MKAVKKLFGSKKNNKRTQSAASDQSSKATSTGRRNTIAVSSIPPQKSIPARRPTETLVSLSKREKEESKPKPLEVRKVAEDTVAPVLRGNETAIKPDIETQSTLKNRTQMENTPLELSTGEAATATSRNNQEFKDSPEVKKAYDAIPLLDQKKLPRGGCSVDTKAVGRVQVRRVKVACVVSSHHIRLSVWHSTRNYQRQHEVRNSGSSSLHCPSGEVLSRNGTSARSQSC